MAYQPTFRATGLVRGAHSAGVEALPGVIHGPGYEATLREMSQRLARQWVRDEYREEQAKVRPGEKRSATMAEIQAGVKAGKRLYANVPSTCFEELSWHKDVATATFWRGGSITYEYDCDLDTFLSWCSGSLGEFFDAEIR
jgi:hypothetical protein